MTKRQWIIIIGLNLFTLFIILLPFMPGPNFMSQFVNITFNLFQIVGIIGILLIPVGLFLNYKQNVNLKKFENQKLNIFPILLWTLPIILITNGFGMVEVMRNLSRNIAIENSEKLINAIETYKKENKQYPEKIEQLIPNYFETIPNPPILGILKYVYKKKGDNFNLIFSQNVTMGFNFENVVYDKTDKHMVEGKSTILYNLTNKHWKYYIYN